MRVGGGGGGGGAKAAGETRAAEATGAASEATASATSTKVATATGHAVTTVVAGAGTSFAAAAPAEPSAAAAAGCCWHVCELQLHIKPITDAEKTLHSHVAYEYFRSYFSGNDAAVAKRLGVLCLLYTSPSPRDKRQSRMPSSA